MAISIPWTMIIPLFFHPFFSQEFIFPVAFILLCPERPRSDGKKVHLPCYHSFQSFSRYHLQDATLAHVNFSSTLVRGHSVRAPLFDIDVTFCSFPTLFVPPGESLSPWDFFRRGFSFDGSFSPLIPGHCRYFSKVIIVFRISFSSATWLTPFPPLSLKPSLRISIVFGILTKAFCSAILFSLP